MGKIRVIVLSLVISNISAAAIKLPKEASCMSSISGPTLIVKFDAPIAFDYEQTLKREKLYTSIGSRSTQSSCDGDLKANNPAHMMVGTQQFELSTDKYSYMDETQCSTPELSKISFLELSFKNTVVSHYRVQLRLWSSGLMTLEAGSKKEVYDCQINQTF